ncbi:MAG: P-loop NTPase, partial [Myxococcota bacterium]
MCETKASNSLFCVRGCPRPTATLSRSPAAACGAARSSPTRAGSNPSPGANPTRPRSARSHARAPPHHELTSDRDENIIPIEAHGIKLMSMGFLLGDSSPVIVRGPLANRY